MRRRRISVYLWLSIALLAPSFAQPAPASPTSTSAPVDSCYQQALAKGKAYRDRKDYISRELRANKFQVQSAWAKDGISKYVTFYRDKDVLASLAADANAQLRNITVDELKAVPITGLLFANVQLHARGEIGLHKLNRDFTDGKTRLVLRIGNEFVQPAQQGAYPSPPRTGCTQTLYLWTIFGNYRFMVGGITPISFSCDPVGSSSFSLEFAFSLTPQQMSERGEVFIVDGHSRRYSTRVDFSKLR